VAFEEKLSGSLEDNVLTCLCFDSDNAAIIAVKVDPRLFSTRAYQKIAKVSIDYLEHYGKPPRSHLRDLLEQDLKRGEEGRFLNQILDAMDRLAKDLQPEYVLQELDRFIRIRQMTLQVRKAEDSLHAGDLEGAEVALAEIETVTQQDYPGVWFHDEKQWLSFLDREDDVDIFSSGIGTLDEKGVRPRRGSLFLVVAPTGKGKSFWLRQIARDNVLLCHKKVLFLTLENDLEETQQFLTMAFLGATSENHQGNTIQLQKFVKDDLQRLTKIESNQITADQLKPARRTAIAKKLKPYQKQGKLYVQWFPSGSLTLRQLDAFLDWLSKSEGFEPDMMVVDYPDLMQIDEKTMRTSLGRVFVGIRGIGGKRKMAVVAATQGNRGSSEAKVVTTAMVAEDWSKIATADTVCTYSQTSAEADLGLARVLVAKARRAVDKWIALITQSYATGQFCVDSVYFSKYAQKEIDRRSGESGENEAED
jgi:replicative DNA helicase